MPIPYLCHHQSIPNESNIPTWDRELMRHPRIVTGTVQATIKGFSVKETVWVIEGCRIYFPSEEDAMTFIRGTSFNGWLWWLKQKNTQLPIGVLSVIALVALCFFGWFWSEHSHFVYECKHEVMMKELAEVRGWYFGEHGETLSTEQYDWAYNEASDALRDLGNATSK